MPEKQPFSRENRAKLARFTRENASGAALNTATVAERVRALMAKFDMSRAALARVLRTPGRTLDGWLDEGRTPPACMLSLLDVIEGSGQARRILGVHAIRQKGKSRGRPFRRGNEWRFGDRRRKEALKQAAAIQAQQRSP